MKFRTARLFTYAFIALLSIFTFDVQAGAQDNVSNQRSRSFNSSGKTATTRKTKIEKPASTYNYSVLYSFCPEANCPDGVGPNAGLIQDTAGNLYGTTTAGGASANGGGTVFKLNQAGQETVLYSFCSETNGNVCSDGSMPFGSLVQDAAGNLYGTTNIGGGTNCPTQVGCGTVFKLDSTGQETVLYSFCPNGSPCTDGSEPIAGLILDAAGNLYGTTPGGGSSNNGTVFEVDAAGDEIVLYSFCSQPDCTDGADPEAGLIEDAAGNLYGTTSAGGANGSGTVFKLDNAGNETVLYSFCSVSNCTDGQSPAAGLIQDAAGNLYGATLYGGANTAANYGYGGGTVFEVSAAGQETVLYSFCSAANCVDGFLPYSNLIQDSGGNLYGTTTAGGNSNSNCAFGSCGTVFEVNLTGHETVLYSFCSAANCVDGATSYAGLLQDSAGNLYGTTYAGGNGGNPPCAAYNGSAGCGAIFELSTGGQSTPIVTLTSNLNPSYVDQSVTFLAVISGSGPTPTGSVTFVQGTNTLGTVTLANGQASLATAFTSAGSFIIVASYSGDQNYKAANSGPLTQVVNQYTTSTALTSSLNPSTYGQPVTLTATIASAGPVPTGTVAFKDGKKSLGSASVSGGVAQFTTSTLKVGSGSITASYSGDPANEASTAPALKQVVDKATSATTVVSSLDPSQVGQKVTFTATVISSTTTPTGTVEFLDGTTKLGAIGLKKGKASYSTKTLSAGSHNITAVYEGTADIAGSTSPVLVQIVN